MTDTDEARRDYKRVADLLKASNIISTSALEYYALHDCERNECVPALLMVADAQEKQAGAFRALAEHIKKFGNTDGLIAVAMLPPLPQHQRKPRNDPRYS